MTPSPRQPPLFSFSITGQVPEDLQQVLDLAVRSSLLPPSDFTGKQGGQVVRIHFTSSTAACARPSNSTLAPSRDDCQFPSNSSDWRARIRKKFVKVRLQRGRRKVGLTLFDLEADDENAGGAE